jgi:hypothetical protein
VAFTAITVKIVASDATTVTFQSGNTTIKVSKSHLKDLMDNETERMNFVFMQMALLLFQQGINPIATPALAKTAIEAATFYY